ncbi:MAG: phytanoyl-CoA dioxygenase family protein [Pseudomonadota bacterium]
MRPVRAVGFDKRAGSNWAVPWHQDRVIAVKDRRAVSGFSGWSQKAGVWHCSPPLEVLRPMLFLRLHLDACSAENGVMEIALGSHHAGLVAAFEAAQVAGRYTTEVTEAAAGDVLVLSMLVLHRSCPSGVDAPRRTLRVDLADRGLPCELVWAM